MPFWWTPLSRKTFDGKKPGYRPRDTQEHYNRYTPISKSSNTALCCLPSVSYRHSATYVSIMNEIGRVSSTSIPSPNESSTLPTSPSTTSAAESFRARHFAQRRLLSWWFPRIDDDETKSWRIWASRRSRALMIQILTIGIILVTNLSVTLFAVSKYGSQDGVGLIYEGDCNTVKKLSLWIHLLINLLGTGMLSASNYCMQLQAAPTRANVDKAHAKGTWLDIGVPSLRNLRHLGRKRILTWLLLALSSVPIHLL